MKLDPDLIHYLTKEHFRVLTAIEMGMKNHEYVPGPLIESLAALKRANTYKVLQLLLKHKCIMHTGKNYSGYALTYMGYDYLALKAFMKRGIVRKLICKIGTGKESDIYICEAGKQAGAVQTEQEKGKEEEQKSEDDEEEGKQTEIAEESKKVSFETEETSNFVEKLEPGDPIVIKFARLGRTSFRTVVNNRDYMKGRSANWLYMSRIASLKEYAFMKALYKRGFPTPIPIDSNRHGIVMSLIKAYPMGQVKSLSNPEKVYHELVAQIIRLAEHGLVHGDFNEFNLMINEEEEITVIDFP